MLSWLLQNNLWKLAAIYGESADVASFPDPHLEVLIGGYGSNQTARIAKIIIDLKRVDGFDPTVSVDDREVKDGLEYLTAGLDLDAQARLHYPQNFPGEPALACIIHEGTARGRWEREIATKMLFVWMRLVELPERGGWATAQWMRWRFSGRAFPDTHSS